MSQTQPVVIVFRLGVGGATILMSDSGALYAQGENNDNRLGLAQDSWTSWFTYEPVEEGGQKVRKKEPIAMLRFT